LADHGSGDGLGAEECTGGVNVEGSAELEGRHVDGVDAAYDAGETEEYVDCAECGDCLFYGERDSVGVCDVELFGEDFGAGKGGLEFGDGGLGLRGVHVEDHKVA